MLEEGKLVQKNLLEFLMSENEITWQSIILDLIKSSELDPWDIDISILANKYIAVIRQLKESNLFISGKVLLASAMLLKFKADKLLSEGITSLDNLMFPPVQVEELEFSGNVKNFVFDADPHLTIKTPQARKRKVSINELIGALEKALEVNERRLLKVADRNRFPDSLRIPDKPRDVGEVINELYKRIQQFFSFKPILLFSELIPSESREDKISTFVPLLHLSNHDKVEINQEDKQALTAASNEEGNDIKNMARKIAELSDAVVLVAFEKNNIYYTGIANLLTQPEFADFDLIYDLSFVVDHLDEVIEKIFDSVRDTEIKIGKDNYFAKQCTSILTKVDDKMLGILGPIRMDYERNLGLINYTKKLLA